MLRCVVCQAIVPLDEAEVPVEGVCICRPCWQRILDQTPQPIPSEYDEIDPTRLTV